MMNWQTPPEYLSLEYLRIKLGDIETVNCICFIWNILHSGDTLRVLRDDGYGVITITGRCSDLKGALDLCKYLTTFGVAVNHQKTTHTETWGV